MSAAGRLWHAAGTVAAPLLPFYLRRRARRGKELPERLPERRGEGAAVARPPGPLLWLHAASVGESLSILPLLEALGTRRPDLRMLVTTGTVTSATLLAERMPAAVAPRVAHRFAPLDVPAWGGRFLDAWQPDAGVFVESELWPNLIGAARDRGMPLALVNARLSPRSARWWGRAPGLAREILGGFRLVLAQSPGDAERLAALGASGVACWGNLKYASRPLPADPVELTRLRRMVAGRPVLLAASTHPGEEAVVLAAHRLLAPAHPGLLTVLVPRHPQRGAAVAALAAGGGDLPVTRRTTGGDPHPGVAVHVADTLGELGLFYRLANAALIGKSLVGRGGQNPLEPARLGCPVLFGPHMENFADIAATLLAADGAVRVPDRPDPVAALARAAGDVLSDPVRARSLASAAAAVAADQAGLPGRVAEALLRLLPSPVPATREDGAAAMVANDDDDGMRRGAI